MVHLSTPGRDLGHFCTDEVRPRSSPTAITGRTIAFPRNHYKEPPNVAGGFKMLDLSHQAPAVRANLVGSDITPQGFHITLETWDGGVLWGAGAQWIEHKNGSKECHFGQFDTRDVKRKDAQQQGQGGGGGGEIPQEYKKRFKFPRTFQGGANPSVICWLNRLDMQNGAQRNWRINAYATDVDTQGATFHIDTWGDSVLNGAAMCWIAFPAGKKKVDCGSFSTGEVRPWHEAASRNSKRVRFKEGWFGKPPTVLVGLNMLDMAGNSDLRVEVDASDVDNEGFTWHLDTWDDSTLYGAGASWIALGFE